MAKPTPLKAEDLPDILTARHIAEYLAISRRRVYELFQLSQEHGGIPNFAIGASKRAEKSDFLNWVEGRKTEKQQITKKSKAMWDCDLAIVQIIEDVIRHFENEKNGLPVK